MPLSGMQPAASAAQHDPALEMLKWRWRCGVGWGPAPEDWKRKGMGSLILEAYIVGSKGAGKDPHELWALQTDRWKGCKSGLTPSPQFCTGCHRPARFPQAPASLPSLSAAPPCKKQLASMFRLSFWALKRKLKGKGLGGLLRFTNWPFLPMPVCSLTAQQCFDHQYNWIVKWQEMLWWPCPTLPLLVDLTTWVRCCL